VWARGRSVLDISRAHVGKNQQTNELEKFWKRNPSSFRPNYLALLISHAFDSSLATGDYSGIRFRPPRRATARFLVGVSTPIRSASTAHWTCSAELRRVQRPRPAIGPQPTAATATRRLASPAPSSTSVSSRCLGRSLGLVLRPTLEQFVAVRGFGVRLL
jgi:hypothetical protein